MKLSRKSDAGIARDINLIINKLEEFGINTRSIFASTVEIIYQPECSPLVHYKFSDELEELLMPFLMLPINEYGDFEIGAVENSDRIYQFCRCAIIGIAYIFETDKTLIQILGDELEIRYETAIEGPAYISAAKSIDQAKRARRPRVSNDRKKAGDWFNTNQREDMNGYEFFFAMTNLGIKISERTAERWLKELKNQFRQ